MEISEGGTSTAAVPSPSPRSTSSTWSRSRTGRLPCGWSITRWSTSLHTPAERVALLESNLAEYGGIPFLGISYTGTGSDGKPRGWDSEVAEGPFDDEIRMIARAVAQDGRPFFIRPGFEFNGTWNAYQPDPYRESFVRIRTLFFEEGAGNAIWVWNAHPAGTVAPFMEFLSGR